jgi:hypothetical protein
MHDRDQWCVHMITVTVPLLGSSDRERERERERDGREKKEAHLIVCKTEYFKQS